MDFKTNKLSNQNLKLTGRTQQQKGKKKQNVLTQRQINTNHPIGQEKKRLQRMNRALGNCRMITKDIITFMSTESQKER